MALPSQLAAHQKRSELERMTLSKFDRDDGKDKENVDPNPKAKKSTKVSRRRITNGPLRSKEEIISQPTLKSHLDRLPAEILVMIYEELSQEDIIALRLQCKYLCNIATPYMFRDVDLIFKKTSINDLIELSNHPVLSQNVKSICYEPNLVDRMTRYSWEKSMPMVDYHETETIPAPPKQSASQREWRLHERNVRKIVFSSMRRTRTQQELDIAWPIYERYLQEQEDLIDRDWACQDLKPAFERFPNLEALYVNFGWGLWCGDPNSNPFRDGLCKAVPGSRYHWMAPGLGPTIALMKMLGKSDVKLTSLRIGNLNWRFFEECEEKYEDSTDEDEWEDEDDDDNEDEGEDKDEDGDEDMEEDEDIEEDEDVDEILDRDIDMYHPGAGDLYKAMNGIVKSLLDIKLVITTWSDEYDDEDEGSTEINQCHTHLQNGILARLLANAPNLHKLAIGFDTIFARHAADLHNIVMDTHWPHLHTIKLTSIDAYKADWMAFFERHAQTLKHIALGAIVLLDGSWPDVLERTQKLLSLHEAHFNNELYSLEYDQMWNFDPPGACSSKDDSVRENRTRWALEKFMVEGGVCPLRDEDAHPQMM